MPYFFKFLILLFFCSIIVTSCTEEHIIDCEKWDKVTLTFEGPETSESSKENPFLNYRLNVTFDHPNGSITVPGFYAADGNSAESSATNGNIWKAHFRPDKEGEWTYKVSFRKGESIAVSDVVDAGEVTSFNGQEGKIRVVKGSNADGRLRYTGNRYLQYSESGKYFIKGGCDSPENVLGFEGIDGTVRGQSPEERKGEAKANSELHKFEAHIKDYKEGDPSWQDGKGKGLIGGLNYLATKGINSLYFLAMNIDGDGKEVYPYTSYDERLRFDCSKLAQWEIVFDHMDDLNMMQHFVLQETENELLLDGGDTKIERKIFYREMIARYSHHPRLTWNLGEENGPVFWHPEGQSTEQQKAMLQYIHDHDPYENFTVIHSHSDQKTRDSLFKPLLALPSLDGMSMQVNHKNEIHDATRQWLDESKAAKRAWVMNIDEIGPWYRGVDPDDRIDNNQDTVRAEVLWGNLMAGGAGAEWYFGAKNHNNDLNCEDWRTRDRMWEYTTHARLFFENHLPFSEMQGRDDLISGDRGYCFAKENQIYVVYLLFGGRTALDLSEAKGTYEVQWYNPRAGGELLQGSVDAVSGGGKVDLGQPPKNPDQDWAILIRRK